MPFKIKILGNTRFQKAFPEKKQNLFHHILLGDFPQKILLEKCILFPMYMVHGYRDPDFES